MSEFNIGDLCHHKLEKGVVFAITGKKVDIPDSYYAKRGDTGLVIPVQGKNLVLIDEPEEPATVAITPDEVITPSGEAITPSKMGVAEIDTAIIVEQLPIIKERLSLIGQQVSASVGKALALPCTNETIQAVKKARSGLTKELKALEEKRIQTKKAVLAPYNEFEAIYKQHITDQYSKADLELKKRIAFVEDEVKNAIRKDAIAYWNELCAAEKVDFVGFERTGVPVNLTVKLLAVKKQLRAFMTGVVADLEMIKGLADDIRDEVSIEYRRTLNATQSLSVVMERKKEIAAQKEREAALAAAKKAEEEAAKKVMEAVAPELEEPGFAAVPAPPVEEEVPEAPPVDESKLVDESEATLSFRVTATIPMLRKLKTFLVEGGYKFE